MRNLTIFKRNREIDFSLQKNVYDESGYLLSWPDCDIFAVKEILLILSVCLASIRFVAQRYVNIMIDRIIFTGS